MSAINELSVELKTFSHKLPDLIGQTGKYVVIRGEEVVGVYDTYEDAVKVGYAKFGLNPFLIKQIAPTERVMSFTRDHEFVCQA